ncbi:LapA family protein [Sinimarinibacterium sp. CAU 1509]|uniref:LapA family protein n=1 Tax=Sinimarinibacterium sp. CAU 1509 TaxID=2562283 RepID=UPI0010AC587C|nr:LapA family protein [Sinimarinibacterium sp. CAU 1509]TJY62218.1 LapA family protein [Sinimarinibacterium sp. CAU 1509]
MWRIVLLVLLIAVLVLGASIGYFNAQSVTFNYLLGEWQIPLIALLIADFAFGVLIALAVAAARILSLRLEVRRLRGRIRENEAELRNLRNLPVNPEPSIAAPPTSSPV